MEKLQNQKSNILSWLAAVICPLIPQYSMQDFRTKSLKLSKTITVYDKLTQLRNAAHELVWGNGKYKQCACNGSKCKYFNGNSDQNLFKHALSNTHENVPQCYAEPHINTGYVLVHQPTRYYWKVLWIPNNELLNVWTHLIPALYFLKLLYQYSLSDKKLDEAWPLFLVVIGSFGLTFCSSLAHTFHSRSSYHHCCWFILDFFGISVYAWSSLTVHFFASAELDYYKWIGWFNLPIITLVGVAGFYCCCLSQRHKKGGKHTHSHRNLKVYANAIGYFYGIIPLAHRLMTCTNDDPTINLHVKQFVCMFICPILYASDIPQRFSSGTFDIVGHSHQFFHIFSALSCYFDILAIQSDVTSERYKLLRQQADYPSIEQVIAMGCVLCVTCFFIAKKFAEELRQHFKQEVDILEGCSSPT